MMHLQLLAALPLRHHIVHHLAYLVTTKNSNNDIITFITDILSVEITKTGWLL